LAHEHFCRAITSQNTEDELDCLSVIKSAIATNDKSFIISDLYRVDNALGIIFQNCGAIQSRVLRSKPDVPDFWPAIGEVWIVIMETAPIYRPLPTLLGAKVLDLWMDSQGQIAGQRKVDDGLRIRQIIGFRPPDRRSGAEVL